jgi:hypothetical protein
MRKNEANLNSSREALTFDSRDVKFPDAVKKAVLRTRSTSYFMKKVRSPDTITHIMLTHEFLQVKFFKLTNELEVSKKLKK